MDSFTTKQQYGSPTPHQTGLGNIDLDQRLINLAPAEQGNEWYNRPNGHPTLRTEESITVNDGLGFVNIPTIIGGNKVSDRDAIMYYNLTGQHLGRFNPDGSMTPWKEAADAAQNIHLRQQQMYTSGE